MGATIYNPAMYRCESDTSIIWLEEPRRRYAKNQQGVDNFAQTQQIIRECLTLLGPVYAVVRSDPHEDQNEHDEFGRNASSCGEELYLQGHIYLEKILRSDGKNVEEFDYQYPANPSTRKYHHRWGEKPASEEWWYTQTTYKVSSGPAHTSVGSSWS
ncbi:hypothetical protein B0H65DRAFT_553716 [Neurospora tetraspora]|uniref:Uncharacterized protein n=1 Tax=Neurospora tetraspora TaxID=94610 RepID=A0AAE0J0N3_9PEZI|nr:hypothetical protein B0H65DRAFT_553716 [Neurospora tetraspora]